MEMDKIAKIVSPSEQYSKQNGLTFMYIYSFTVLLRIY